MERCTKQSLQLDSRATALLLVDLQEEQRSDPRFPVADFGDILGNARELLEAARRAHVTVLHAAYHRDLTASPPLPFEPVDAHGVPSFSSADSPGVAICSEVAPRVGEPVILKNEASAFTEPALEAELRRRGTSWLLVAGVWTEACVAATVRDASRLGFHVLLVKDACGSGTRAMHRTGVLEIANRLYGGGVCDTDRALRLIAGEAADVWRNDGPVPLLYTLETVDRLYRSL